MGDDLHNGGGGDQRADGGDIKRSGHGGQRGQTAAELMLGRTPTGRVQPACPAHDSLSSPLHSYERTCWWPLWRAWSRLCPSAATIALAGSLFRKPERMNAGVCPTGPQGRRKEDVRLTCRKGDDTCLSSLAVKERYEIDYAHCIVSSRPPVRPRVCRSAHPAGTLLGTKANGLDTAWLSAHGLSE